MKYSRLSYLGTYKNTYICCETKQDDKDTSAATLVIMVRLGYQGMYSYHKFLYCFLCQHVKQYAKPLPLRPSLSVDDTYAVGADWKYNYYRPQIAADRVTDANYTKCAK